MYLPCHIPCQRLPLIQVTFTKYLERLCARSASLHCIMKMNLFMHSICSNAGNTPVISWKRLFLRLSNFLQVIIKWYSSPISRSVQSSQNLSVAGIFLGLLCLPVSIGRLCALMRSLVMFFLVSGSCIRDRYFSSPVVCLNFRYVLSLLPSSFILLSLYMSILSCRSYICLSLSCTIFVNIDGVSSGVGLVSSPPMPNLFRISVTDFSQHDCSFVIIHSFSLYASYIRLLSLAVVSLFQNLIWQRYLSLVGIALALITQHYWSFWNGHPVMFTPPQMHLLKTCLVI